jgi:hypothetical protein
LFRLPFRQAAAVPAMVSQLPSQPLGVPACLRLPSSRTAPARPPLAHNLLALPLTARPAWLTAGTAGDPTPVVVPPAHVAPRLQIAPVAPDSTPGEVWIADDVDSRFEKFRNHAHRRIRFAWIDSAASLARNPRLWIGLAAALLLALLLRPSHDTTVAAAATATAHSPAAADQVLSRQWREMQQRILHRAAVNLQDDFRSGLSDWRGRPNWSRDWRYDPAGFVRTGSLAFFTPSMSMEDYSVEFLGQIERKALSWVVRAQDFHNYYVFKVVIDRPGPLPAASLVHYAVVGGRETARSQVRLPLSLRRDSLFRIRVDVRGQDFTTSVHGQVVDFWSDSRLSWGGVGFFSAKGEQSRVRWIEVSHQYDMLGRLCAWMAPYGMAPSQGGLNQ